MPPNTESRPYALKSVLFYVCTVITKRGSMETTPLGEKILSVMRESGGWLTRRQLAERMGRRVFSPYDLTILKGLVAGGVVEESKRPFGIVREEHIYRLKGE